VARVLLLSADLLFGSRVQGDLSLAGHEVEQVADEPRLRARLANEQAPGAELLLVDLTDDRLDGATILERLASEGNLAGVRRMAFYSHVDVEVRTRAERAGFELIVPRSRMAREGGELVNRLLADA
jgi:CheY-like chemotaxis protein